MVFTVTWWLHDIETLSALLAILLGVSTGYKRRPILWLLMFWCCSRRSALWLLMPWCHSRWISMHCGCCGCLGSTRWSTSWLLKPWCYNRWPAISDSADALVQAAGQHFGCCRLDVSRWCFDHDDVINWKENSALPGYWPFMWGIHRAPVNSPHKIQWRGALVFSLICAWINGWVNNGEAGDLVAIAPIMTSLWCVTDAGQYWCCWCLGAI